VKITAAVCRAQGEDFRIEEIDLEEPRDDEVLVRTVGAGVCHTDLICRDQWYPVPLPAVFGHEGSGVIEAVGKNVTKVKPGDHVVMSFMSCGVCKSCRIGRPAYCAELYGRNFSGGRPDETSALSSNGERVNGHFFGQSSWATHSIAYERSVVKVDPEADLALLGPLGCGIQTGAGAVFNSLNPNAGTSIAVFGTGSVGLAAIMAAKAVGCTTIIAVDIKDQRIALAKELGATHGVNPSDGTNSVEAIKDLTDGGVDFALEMTASPKVFRNAVECLAPLGTVGIIGAAALGTEYTFDMNDVMLPGKTIKGLIEGDSVPDVFIPRLVALIQQGKFPLDRLVTNYKLDDINTAAHDTEAGVSVKPVVVFS
jgi:aryl-alcohol dehydrogenase